MNPSIEVQITARLDKLDAGLRLAEAKVMSSTTTMGKAGGSAGSAFADKMVGNMTKGLAIGTITNVLGGGILKAVQGINLSKSGSEIGTDIMTGIVDGAKSIPLAGILFSILDEVFNGAYRRIAELSEILKTQTDAVWSGRETLGTKRESFLDTAKKKVEDVIVGDNPDLKIRMTAARESEAAKKSAESASRSQTERTAILTALMKTQEAEAEKFRLQMQEAGYMDRFVNAEEWEKKRLDMEQTFAIQKQAIDKEFASHEEQIATALAKQLEAIDTERLTKLKALHDTEDKERKAKAEDLAKQDADALQKARDVAQKAQDDAVKKQEEAQKKELDRALQAQQDIIDANTQAQDKIDKVGRLDRMAQDAGQGLISSGQTALGQFNFAQDGASGQALALAQKQVTALEAIEKATAEQVRLTKGGQEFR